MRAVATTPPVAAELSPGTKVAQRYEVHKRLGSGAMGVVYLAEDLELQRKVALKLQHFDPASPIADAVLQEATAMARLQHPNVVAVYEVGRIGDDQLYIEMKYVDGESVGQWLGTPHELPRRSWSVSAKPAPAWRRRTLRASCIGM